MPKILSTEHKNHIRDGMIRYWDGKRHAVMNKNGYLTLTIGNKKRYVHRMVMEEQLGRPLMPNEAVHHINGDKTDNRIENLVLMTNAEHKSHHAKERGFGYDRIGIPPSNKTSQEMIDRIRALRREGYILEEIMQRTGLSYPTVQKYAKGVKQ